MCRQHSPRLNRVRISMRSWWYKTAATELPSSWQLTMEMSGRFCMARIHAVCELQYEVERQKNKTTTPRTASFQGKRTAALGGIWTNDTRKSRRALYQLSYTYVHRMVSYWSLSPLLEFWRVSRRGRRRGRRLRPGPRTGSRSRWCRWRNESGRISGT